MMGLETLLSLNVPPRTYAPRAPLPTPKRDVATRRLRPASEEVRRGQSVWLETEPQDRPFEALRTQCNILEEILVSEEVSGALRLA